MRATVVVIILLALALSPVHAAAPQAVDDAIRRGVKYLYDVQNDFGNWEASQKPPPDNGLGSGTDEGQWGGRTALCTYALLAAGERSTEPKIRRAVDWLRTAKISGSYAIGVRANVWFYLPQTPATRASMLADAAALRRNRSSGASAANRGLFDYKAGGPRIDLSCSQYGVLGCWAAAQRVDAFDPGFWSVTEKAWCDQQNDDGGWSYNGRGGDSTIQMTAAGVATLFITQELAHASDRDKKAVEAGRLAEDQINRGLDFIGQNLQHHLQFPLLYALYGIERVGVASGYKYIGGIDWYNTCADVLLARQDKEGPWYNGQFDPPIETSFALLFLSRGRAPIMVNKLEYNLNPSKSAIALAERSGKPVPKPTIADWDLRPRDIANITRWTEDKIERRMNWQTVKLGTATVDDLHDAGLLYMTGDQPINLNDDEKAKLKQYVEEGGLIVASGDGIAPAFSKTFATLGEELFPGLKFKPLTPDSGHVLLTGEQFAVRGQKKPIEIEVLSNGARLLMILAPKADLSGIYQRREVSKVEAYEFFANAYLYSIEKSARNVKGETHIVRPDPATQPTRRATLARLKYDGQWDPEPGGWRRLTAILHNSADIELTTKPVELGKDAVDGIAFAHLTGTSAFTLTDRQRDKLRKYLESGGLLVIDNCGGNAAFDTTAHAELSKLIPDAESQLLAPLPADHPIFTDAAGRRITPQYRNFGLPQLGPLASDFQLRGLTINGKLAVLYSPQDLGVGLVGQSVDGIIGYAPSTATTLMRQIIELRIAGKL